MKSEEEFIRESLDLIRELTGDESAGLGPDTELLATGWFDSLLLVSFLDFIETQRGAPLPISAENGIPMEKLATIRAAYQLVVAPG